MSRHGGAQVIRFGEMPWEARATVDGWPCMAGMYRDDRDCGLTLRMIDYPAGSTEPRHVHAGTHATTVLRGRALIDGLELAPLDLVLGPGGEPHGPLHYPDGCLLLSAFQGDYVHGEVEQLSRRKLYRVIQQEAIPWRRYTVAGGELKTLASDVGGRLTVQAMRFPSGGAYDFPRPPGQTDAYLLLAGRALLSGESLGVWDMVYLASGVASAPLAFLDESLVLALMLRQGAPVRQPRAGMT